MKKLLDYILVPELEIILGLLILWSAATVAIN
jgi:hypothetical protein